VRCPYMGLYCGTKVCSVCVCVCVLCSRTLNLMKFLPSRWSFWGLWACSVVFNHCWQPPSPSGHCVRVFEQEKEERKDSLNFKLHTGNSRNSRVNVFHVCHVCVRCGVYVPSTPAGNLWLSLSFSPHSQQTHISIPPPFYKHPFTLLIESFRTFVYSSSGLTLMCPARFQSCWFMSACACFTLPAVFTGGRSHFTDLITATYKAYILPFKSLGSLRNVFIFQRKALFFQ